MQIIYLYWFVTVKLCTVDVDVVLARFDKKIKFLWIIESYVLLEMLTFVHWRHIVLYVMQYAESTDILRWPIVHDIVSDSIANNVWKLQEKEA